MPSIDQSTYISGQSSPTQLQFARKNDTFRWRCSKSNCEKGKVLWVQLQWKMFDCADPTRISRFFWPLLLPATWTRTHEGISIWLSCALKNLQKSMYKSSHSRPVQVKCEKSRNFNLFVKLENHSTVPIIAKALIDIKNFQLAVIRPSGKLAQVPWTKILPSSQVWDEYHCKGRFGKATGQSIP